MLIFREVAVDF